MIERYKIIKELYPNYLILIKDKEKLKSIRRDKIIIDTFGINNIKNTNKLILNNLDIETLEKYEENKYNEYYIKSMLIKIVKEIFYEKENINN